MFTVSPAKDGDDSTWITAGIADELVSATGVGSIYTVMSAVAAPALLPVGDPDALGSLRRGQPGYWTSQRIAAG
jgi:hypothetical protein